MTSETVTKSKQHGAKSINSPNSNTSTNNARTERRDPYNTIDRKLHEQTQLKRKMKGFQFHDTEEQHWLELEQLVYGRREHILPVGREEYALPIDPNIQIYDAGRGNTYLLEQIETPWLAPEPLTSYARSSEYYALREIALGPEGE